jgi:multidrug efflux pump subunit AcrB
VLSSSSLNPSQLYDFGQFRVRQQMIGVPGMRLPQPYGGAGRQIMVDLDLQALNARGITPLEVSRAVNLQNLTLPSGSAKIGDIDHIVEKSKGGTDALSNLRLCHKACHLP